LRNCSAGSIAAARLKMICKTRASEVLQVRLRRSRAVLITPARDAPRRAETARRAVRVPCPVRFHQTWIRPPGGRDGTPGGINRLPLPCLSESAEAWCARFAPQLAPHLVATAGKHRKKPRCCTTIGQLNDVNGKTQQRMLRPGLGLRAGQIPSGLSPAGFDAVFAVGAGHDPRDPTRGFAMNGDIPGRPVAGG
jgi:hypothetical protein